MHGWIDGTGNTGNSYAVPGVKFPVFFSGVPVYDTLGKVELTGNFDTGNSI